MREVPSMSSSVKSGLGICSNGKHPAEKISYSSTPNCKGDHHSTDSTKSCVRNCHCNYKKIQTHPHPHAHTQENPRPVGPALHAAGASLPASWAMAAQQCRTE